MSEKAVTRAAGPTQGESASSGGGGAKPNVGANSLSRRIQTRLSGVHGKGVFAVQDIAEGERLIETVGEVITWKEAPPRQPAQPRPLQFRHARRRAGTDAGGIVQ